MKIIPFKEMYYTSFVITEAIAKLQNWFERNNFYSCIGKPKPSHTFLWFKNCRGRIICKDGTVIEVQKNQLTYMAKNIEYYVEFFDTAPGQVDSIVFHFQLYNADGEEFCPTLLPVICIKNVDISLGMFIDTAAEEFEKNIVCVPEIISVIYRIFAHACKKQRQSIAKNKFSYIRTGIELLESNTDKSIEEIAHLCGVSEGYFRKLFREYSGDNPIDFRQKHRIEKAKQLLSLDTFSIGEIAVQLKFTDIYHFSKTFKKYCGSSPNKYIKSKQK